MAEGGVWQVERCTLVSRSGVLTDLEPSPDGAAAVVPTFTPAQFERAMNTRAAASSMERRQRTMTVRTHLPLACSSLPDARPRIMCTCSQGMSEDLHVRQR